jgi:glyoxylase-like metal-dependent hydrolase (beta-lactamase superfamily II)
MKETKMDIYFYKAECGDASRIRFYGTDDKYHNVFIDSGYRRTFKNIIDSQIQEIIENEEIIDLWIISHIHDDHIGGIEQYIKQIEIGQSKDIVYSWFYNNPRRNNLAPEGSNNSDSSANV